MDCPGGGREQETPVARAALPAATNGEIEAFRAVARPGIARGDLDRGRRGAAYQEGKDATDQTYRLLVTSGASREEFTGLTLKRGRGYLADEGQLGVEADRDQGDRRRASGRCASRSATYMLAAPAVEGGEITAEDFRETSQRAGAWAAPPRSTR